ARLQAQMLWMAGQSGSIGLGTVGQWSIYDRDLILDLFEQLTGGRVYHMYIYPGGVRRELPDGFLEKLEIFLDYLEKKLPKYDDIFFYNATFKSRAVDVGVVTKKDALKNGYVGQVLRGCGIKRDVRKDNPYLVYDKLDFEIPVQEAGDVYARALVRRDEIKQSIKILRQVIKDIPQEGEIMQKIPKHRKFTIPKDDIYVASESARGEFGYYMAGDGTQYIRRMQVKGPSLIHGFTLLEKLLINEELSNVAMIMNSLGICPPEIER
ncbi:MAG: NADH-quinone oxidoreductase subunit D, partial [Campylobacterota bacterium]|nr:NADH-quinone oxidoreductase subunit D [Campylobacterota bacterium]